MYVRERLICGGKRLWGTFGQRLRAKHVFLILKDLAALKENIMRICIRCLNCFFGFPNIFVIND